MELVSLLSALRERKRTTVYFTTFAVEVIMADEKNIRSLGCQLDEVDSQVSDSITTLNNFSPENLVKFMKPVISWLISPGTVDLMGELSKFAGESGISEDVNKSVLRGLFAVLKGSLRNNLKSQQLEEDLVSLGLKENLAKEAAKAWSSNIASITRSTLGQTLVINELVDMDWKFGVTASSDDVESVGSTFLQLKLVINKGLESSAGEKAGVAKEIVYMELTLPQFYSFLAEMEKAKSVVEFLSSNA